MARAITSGGMVDREALETRPSGWDVAIHVQYVRWIGDIFSARQLGRFPAKYFERSDDQKSSKGLAVDC